MVFFVKYLIISSIAISNPLTLKNIYNKLDNSNLLQVLVII